MSFLYKGKEIPVGGGSGGGGGSSEEIYSTEETRIGTWIDGKPLYRRVVEARVNGSTNQWIKIAEISGIDQMISAYGKVNTSDNSGQVAVPSQVSIIKLIPPNNLSFATTSTVQLNTTIYIIISYTKTTD